MLKRICLLSFAGLILIISGCAGSMLFAPPSFVRTMEPSWATIELREDISDDKAWNTVLDLLVKRFDIEVIDKASGYARTTWLRTWTGKLTETYRVRVTIKFNREAKTVDIKSEAEYGGEGKWRTGSDSRLLSDIKSGILGSIGRTAR